MRLALVAQDYKELTRLYPEEEERIIKKVTLHRSLSLQLLFESPLPIRGACGLKVLRLKQRPWLQVLVLGRKRGIFDPAAATREGQAGGLAAIQESMEAAEKKKYDLKVIQMISMAAKGDLAELKVR